MALYEPIAAYKRDVPELSISPTHVTAISSHAVFLSVHTAAPPGIDAGTAHISGGSTGRAASAPADDLCLQVILFYQIP